MDQEFFYRLLSCQGVSAGKQISRKQQQLIWRALRMRLGVR